MIKFLFNLTFIYPIKFFLYSIIAFMYIMIFIIELIGWCITILSYVVVFIFSLIKELVAFIASKRKNNTYSKNDIKQSTINNLKTAFPSPPTIKQNIASSFSKKPSITSNNNSMKDIYITIYLSKYYAKKLMKEESFNPGILGIKDYDCPPVDIYDEENYYKFEICEDSNYLAGQVTYLILKFTNGKARCTTGYNDSEIKYKYTYDLATDRVLIDGYTEKEIDKKITKTIKEFNELYEQVDTYTVLSDEDNARDKVVQFFDAHNTDFYLGNDIKELTDKNIITLELSFIEEYLKILKIAQKKFTFKEKSLVFENEYSIEEPQEKVGFFESIFSNKKEEKNLSWQEQKFEREAKLWGLSEEDKRIAKEERMSPADFVEAEERDNDELTRDEWE